MRAWACRVVPEDEDVADRVREAFARPRPGEADSRAAAYVRLIAAGVAELGRHAPSPTDAWRRTDIPALV